MDLREVEKMMEVAIYTNIKKQWKKQKNNALIVRLTGYNWKTVATIIARIEEVYSQGALLTLWIL